jgi:hypothetical protein
MQVQLIEFIELLGEAESDRPPRRAPLHPRAEAARKGWRRSHRKRNRQRLTAHARSRGAAPLGLTYSEPIRCRIIKNVPTLTKAVTPIENRILTSSTCFVLK